MTNPAGNTVVMVNAFTGHAPMDARLDILGDCVRTFVILRVFPISVTLELAYVQRAVRSAGRVCSVKVTTNLHKCKPRPSILKYFITINVYLVSFFTCRITQTHFIYVVKRP